MGISLFIARRYLFSKKSKNAINYITGISVILVAFVTMALIIAMSVFNGLTILVTSLFNTFDPDIKITSATGKVFNETFVTQMLSQEKDVVSYTSVIEDDVLFAYSDKQLVGKIKGVDSAYSATCTIDSMMIAGEFKLQQNDIEFIAVGQGVARSLEVGLQYKDVMQIYAPDRTKKQSSLNPMEDFNKEYAYPRGVFSVQVDIDNSYVISSISLARRILKYGKHDVSAIEVLCNKNTDSKEFASYLHKKLGNEFVVRDREQQHEFLYKITRSEKLITFLIVSLILLIASFSIVGALTMLIIDKKRDIRILTGMGASSLLIKRIFVFEGWMISFAGAIIGIILGLGLSYAQQYFGLLKLGSSDSFLVEAYPVHVQLMDVVYIFAMVCGIGFLTAYIPVNFIIKKHIR